MSPPLLLFLGVMLLGGGLAWWLGRSRGASLWLSLLQSLALAPGFGYGLLSLGYIFPRLAGLGQNPLLILGCTGLLAGLLCWLAPRQPSQAPHGAPSKGKRSFPSILLHLLLLLSALAALVAYHDYCMNRPDGDWDAMAVWNLDARVLFRAEGNPQAVFLGMPLEHHPDYPLLLPAALAAQWSLLGRESETPGWLMFAAFLLGLGLLVYTAVRRVCSPALAAATAGVVLTTPFLVAVAQSQYADVPLAYFLLSLVCGLAAPLPTGRGRGLSPLTTGLCLGLLAWTKNEGLLLAALVLGLHLLTLLSSRSFRSMRRRAFFWMVPGAVLPGLGLGLFKLLWAPPNDYARDVGALAWRHVRDPERYARVGASFLREVSPGQGWERWGLVWVFIGLALLFCARKRRLLRQPALRLASFVALLLPVAWFFVYVLTPRPLAWHLKTSLGRLLLQLEPVLLVWVAWVTGCPEEGTDLLAARRKKETQPDMNPAGP